MKANSTLSIRLPGLAVLLLCCAVASSAENFPGQSPDNSLIKTQQKADELFEKGDYERAGLIYREDLASIGDKFAQYMVGYMYYSGSGVEKDAVAASAWFRLAAERGEEKFVQNRNAVMSRLSDEQRAQSDQMYAELREEMGDIVLITRLIEEDLSVLRRRGNESLPLMPDRTERLSNGQRASAFDEAADRLELRVKYLAIMAATYESVSDAQREQAKRLETEVQREIDAYRSSAR